ncbi:MAG TPA: hypothetical protein VHW46_04395 [Terracidiphilus sp.]|nr:hypothetical protein [Terracidiphilus sp.]
MDDELKLEESLATINEALVNLTNSPGAPQHQSVLAAALSQFSSGAQQLRDLLTPSESSAIAELGGAEFFDPDIQAKVRDAVEHNAMTPAVARDIVKDIARRREAFMQTVSSSLAGLKTLLVPTTPMQNAPSPGTAAFVIPRTIFKNELGEFAKELNFINQLAQHLSEAATEEPQKIELQSLSSSIPMVSIAAGLGVLSLLGTVINSFLDAWAKVQKIRKAVEDVKALGLISKTAIAEMEESIVTTVEDVVEQSTTLCLKDYTKVGRRNELENGLRRDIRRLFGQIELGLSVEIVTHDSDKLPKDTRAELVALNNLAKTMRFPAVAQHTLLLTEGEILEGEIETTKTTRKTTTTHKTTKGKGGQEQ